MRYSPLRNLIVTFLILFLSLLFASIDSAAQIRLAWDPNTESDLAGYGVYYGTASRTYGAPINVGNVTSYTLTGLTPGVTYYFAVTAYDTAYDESGFSNEVYATATETVLAPTVLSGPTGGITGTSYTYSTGGSSSSLGHAVQYQFDWKGDATELSSWGSGTQSKTWTAAGTYNVRARSRCATHTSVVSLWSGSVTVSITNASGVSYTVTTNPSGRQITVDGSTYTAPRTFSWAVGSSHTLSVSSPQNGPSGTRDVFGSWSDGGAQTHSVTAPSSNATYTVSFNTQFTLSTSVNPSGGGTVSPSGSNWYNSGQSVSVSATANSGYRFIGWSEDFLSSANPTSFTMNGPKNVTANFSVNVATTTHVGDLDCSSQKSPDNNNKWIANVVIEVHDTKEQPVARATVSGNWSDGYGGSGSCVTDASGQCTVSSSQIPIQPIPKMTTTFTVNNVTHDTMSYDSSSNHDLDGDSNGTFIVVSVPK